jgi:hypothetical protein
MKHIFTKKEDDIVGYKKSMSLEKAETMEESGDWIRHYDS